MTLPSRKDRKPRQLARRSIVQEWAGLVAVAGGVLVAPAQQLPLARLVAVFPPGLQAGTTNEVTISGSDLEEPNGLRFSDPRITSRISETNPAVFTVFVPAEVAPGWVEVRWKGRFGASNPRPFAIGDRPEISSTGTNSTVATAMELPRETIVNGRTTANQSAWFRFSASAGDRVIARVETRELDSRLEPILELTDAHGRPLGQSRHGFLDSPLPAAGEFRLAVHDVTYRGGDDFVFRLLLSSGPHLDYALPLVLRAGETNAVTLFGRQLPGGRPGKLTGLDGQALEELEVEVAVPAWNDRTLGPVEMLRGAAGSALARETFGWRLGSTNGVSNPLGFDLTTNRVVTSPTNGLFPAVPPVEFSGLFPRRGEQSGVTFEAKKGEVLWIELFAHRLGLPCDPAAVVQRERKTKGEQGETLYADVLELGDTEANLGGIDFNTVSRDAVGRFEAPEDGPYRVVVRDLNHRRADAPRFPYWLSLRRETPAVSLVAALTQPPRLNDNDRAVHTLSPFLRRGETLPVRVLAFRQDGFAGEVELEATDLPAGVAAVGIGVPAGQNTGYIVLSAGDGAPESGVVPLTIRGRPKREPVVDWQTVPVATLARAVTDSNEQAIAVRAVREPVLGLSQEEWAPVTLIPATNRIEAPVDGKLVLVLDAIRRGEFNAAMSLKPAGRTEWDKVKPASLPEKATNGTLEFELAEAKLPAGEHWVWLQGTVAGKYRNNPEALTAAEAEVKAAEQALAAATDADREALEKRKKEAEERRKAAEEKAKPRDVTVMVHSRPFVVKLVPAEKPAAKP